MKTFVVLTDEHGAPVLIDLAVIEMVRSISVDEKPVTVVYASSTSVTVRESVAAIQEMLVRLGGGE